MVQTYAEGIEDITSDTIVNFNQIVNPNNNVNVSYYTYNNGIYNFSAFSGWLNVNQPITIISGHKYYVKFTSNTTDSRISLTNNIDYGIMNNSLPCSNFIIPEYTKNNMILMFNGNNNAFSSTGFIIDITTMFGETVANTITIEQCENLFTAPYYDYTAGTPVILDSMLAYNEGMNYILNKYQTSVLNYGAFSSAYIYQPLSPNPILEKYIDYEVYGSPYFKFRGYLAVPLNRICKAGEIIKFNYNDPGMGGAGGDYLWAGILYSNSFVPVISCEQDETGAFSFVCPFDTDTFMLSVSNSVNRFEFYDVGKWVGDFTVEGASIDLDSIISAAVAGYKNEMSDYYANYYGRYGEGYAVIFEEGKAAGIIEANTSLNVMDYVKTAFITLGDILNIEVFPNFTLGSLFILPIITSAIFFVIKIAKGGGD